MKSNKNKTLHMMSFVSLVSTVMFLIGLYYINRPFEYSFFIQNITTLSRAEAISEAELIQNTLKTHIDNDDRKTRLSLINPYLYQVEIFTDKLLTENNINDLIADLKLRWQKDYLAKINVLIKENEQKLATITDQIRELSDERSLEELQTDQTYRALIEEHMFVSATLEQIELTKANYPSNLKMHYEHYDLSDRLSKETPFLYMVLITGVATIAILWLLKTKGVSHE
ncbi:MAG: hypothetical protein VB009_02785 [Erysipelotrichaceae bacterium]|nr:hypothetical protein [Erysipelotrichaceae bacterium]